MPIELTAHTDAGVHLVSIAEKLSEQLAARAGEHDRDRTYPFEAIESLKASGYFAAPVPAELGGLGVSSAHDLVVASSRLARGDASVAIGVNMHLVAVQNMERRRQVAVAAGHERRARGFAASLEQVARDGMVLAAAVSERSQDLTRPGTSAHRTDSGWRIDGRKFFCTMSPGATHLYVSVRYADDDGIERYAYAMVPTDARGVTVHDDWDALGMRASGSNSVSLDGVELPASGVRGGFRAGDPIPYMERNLIAGLFHAAASLGIAESADQIARRAVAGRLVIPNFTTTTHSQTNGATHVPAYLPNTDERAASPDAPPGMSDSGDARARMQVADNAIDLTAARGVSVTCGDVDRCAPRREPRIRRYFRGAGRPVRGGPGRQGIRRRGEHPRRRPRAGALGRRRLRERQSARARVSRRQSRILHASVGRQPRLRSTSPTSRSAGSRRCI